MLALSPKDTSLYLYVIAPIGGGPCKIGISARIVKRLRDLQHFHPHKLGVYHVKQFAARDVLLRAEQAAHRDLAGHRLQGEWFDVSPERAAETINAVFDRLLAARIAALKKTGLGRLPRPSKNLGKQRRARIIINPKRRPIYVPPNMRETTPNP